MKKFAALVLVLAMSLVTAVSSALAGDEPLYEASEIAQKIGELYGYTPEVKLGILDVPTLEGEDDVFFEIVMPHRSQSYYWDAELVFGQYVMDEYAFDEMIDTFPSWELLPWEDADGTRFCTIEEASCMLKKLIPELKSFGFFWMADSNEYRVEMTVGDNVFYYDMVEEDYRDMENFCISQFVITNLYHEWQER